LLVVIETGSTDLLLVTFLKKHVPMVMAKEDMQSPVTQGQPHLSKQDLSTLVCLLYMSYVRFRMLHCYLLHTKAWNVLIYFFMYWLFQNF